ncbi:hypothetical protein [Aureibacillus halotolerans]|uniref:Lipoprotein n=1 Tax=Aureibacillus halotolerans TaxID=1508390 RepID=A0A4R6TV46_9BACI|nr:hypothetical protein [Aureibacillus halotolerans]TDQ35310.1 hypothetical protein EV213_12297 [Aureibacillus halotolerans]
MKTKLSIILLTLSILTACIPFGSDTYYYNGLFGENNTYEVDLKLYKSANPDFKKSSSILVTLKENIEIQKDISLSFNKDLDPIKLITNKETIIENTTIPEEAFGEIYATITINQDQKIELERYEFKRGYFRP